MRLWHKDLIPVLPRQQLLSQWRECCCIAKNLAENGTPNHMLVNRILEYTSEHFTEYSLSIHKEMVRRGYRPKRYSRNVLIDNILKADSKESFGMCYAENLFEYWHNDRYFWQCYYNLQEKYDCGGITEDEWQKIEEVAASRL